MLGVFEGCLKDRNEKKVVFMAENKKASGSEKETQAAEAAKKSDADKQAAASEASEKKAEKSESQAASEAQARPTLTEGRGGILGVKAGMTQVYSDDGQAQAVTVIQLRDNRVTQKKEPARDGYTAIQVGIFPRKETKANRSQKGHVKKSGGQNFYHYQEFRLPEKADLSGIELGQELSAEFIKEGDWVDLTGVSKGKGFQGVMKRHHFRGGPASHGASIVHRMPGSIGQRTDPGKVWKGKKMAGHMGNERVTVQNVKVVKVDPEKNVILVNGSVPGPKSSIVTIRKAVKKLDQAKLK